MRHLQSENAALALSQIYQVYLAKMTLPGKPLGALLFLGPTGSGKTRAVEAAAEALFGDPHAMVKIDCAEFQHSHEISKLIGEQWQAEPAAATDLGGRRPPLFGNPARCATLTRR